MEKAGKKVAEIEIEFQDGSKKKLSEIPEGKIKGLKFDGKQNAKGNFTSFTCKRGIVSDNGKKYIERRIFQNSDMAEGIVYDLTIPLAEQEFNLIPFSTRLDMYAKSIRVYTDALKAGKGEKQMTPDKLLADALKLGLPASAIEAMKKELAKHGFGK